MSVIKITVNDQNLLITDAPRIAAQGVNENYIEFIFSEDWDGFGKTANFYRDTAPTVIYQSLVDQNGYAAIPHEITDNESWICIGLSGVKDNVVKTSEILKYKIVKGLYVVETSEPSPGIFEQILSKVGEVLTEQETFISEIEADQAAFKSETEADQAAFKSEIGTEIAEFETETAGNIADIDTRMDTFLAGQSTGAGLGTLRTETALFESDTPSRGTMIENNRRSLDIDDDIDNYDYIDIYYGAFEKYNVIRIKPSDVPAYVIPAVDEPLRWSTNSIPEAGSSSNDRAEFTMRKFSGQNKLLFTFARWTIRTDANYYTADDTSLANSGIGILRIIGIKYVPAGKDGELTDIRIGADGTIYPSAGAAVRGQISDLKEELNNIEPGLSEDAKIALLNCFQHVAWIDEHGQDYYDALEDALYPSTGLVRIDAVFTQGSAIINPNTPLNNLKAYLIVTGYYDNGTSKQVNDYSLSGVLEVGTSVITVTKEGVTDTFTVTVTAPYWDYEWSADSGELPSGMTADSYDFTTESGAMFVQQPNLDFNIIGNARIQVEAKFYATANQAIIYSGNNPQLVITNAEPTSGNYRGIKVITSSSLNPENPRVHSMLGVGINGTNALVSGYYTDEYHVYDITAEDNVYTFTVDGESISLTQNANTTPYLGITGIQSAVDSGGATYFAYIKSIKFKELGA